MLLNAFWSHHVRGDSDKESIEVAGEALFPLLPASHLSSALKGFVNFSPRFPQYPGWNEDPEDIEEN
jgi:hypothetical protein